MMSTTRMAMSHRELPRFLKLLNANTTTNLKRLLDFLIYYYYFFLAKCKEVTHVFGFIPPAFA